MSTHEKQRNSKRAGFGTLAIAIYWDNPKASKCARSSMALNRASPNAAFIQLACVRATWLNSKWKSRSSDSRSRMNESHTECIAHLHLSKWLGRLFGYMGAETSILPEVSA